MSTSPRKPGRPPQRGIRKVTLCVRVTPELKTYLEAADGSAANVVEDAIRRTRAFRDWAADRV